MKVTLSGIYSDISGRHGSTVASKNVSGLYLKPYNRPIDPQVSQNYIIRNRFNTFSIAWKALTPTQQLDWNTKALTYTFYDRFSNPYVPNGYQLFLYCNLNDALVGHALLTTPVNYTPAPYPTVSVDPVSIGSATWNLHDWTALAAGNYYIIYWSQLLPSSYYGKHTHVRAWYSISSALGSPVNLYSYLVASLASAPVLNKKFFIVIKTLTSANGIVSAPLNIVRPINA
jgi:hypothetical protein